MWIEHFSNFVGEEYKQSDLLLGRDNISVHTIQYILRWSFFTFIYKRSSKMNYFIYFTSFHSSWEIWTQQIDLAPNVWLHSSVGRATHRQRGGHGFESRWSPDFFFVFCFFFQASSFQLLKLENLVRWSFFTFNTYSSFIRCWLKKERWHWGRLFINKVEITLLGRRRLSTESFVESSFN